mmetsp:Transcript_8692/g.29865  ORF Transcript_8692/g.29865 Transcript_8692/m.29865 type:complete len:221 (-) Transcript_8692:1563-2225(-)
MASRLPLCLFSRTCRREIWAGSLASWSCSSLSPDTARGKILRATSAFSPSRLNQGSPPLASSAASLPDSNSPMKVCSKSTAASSFRHSRTLRWQSPPLAKISATSSKKNPKFSGFLEHSLKILPKDTQTSFVLRDGLWHDSIPLSLLASSARLPTTPVLKYLGESEDICFLIVMWTSSSSLEPRRDPCDPDPEGSPWSGSSTSPITQKSSLACAPSKAST